MFLFQQIPPQTTAFSPSSLPELGLGGWGRSVALWEPEVLGQLGHSPFPQPAPHLCPGEEEVAAKTGNPEAEVSKLRPGSPLTRPPPTLDWGQGDFDTAPAGKPRAHCLYALQLKAKIPGPETPFSCLCTHSCHSSPSTFSHCRLLALSPTRWSFSASKKQVT